jgi:hypothetical protein
VAANRAPMWLFAGFAAIGVYGVLSYYVAS